MVKMMETIRRRRSVRTFDGSTLRDEDRKKILEFAEKVENPYDLPITWKILEAKRYGLNSPVIVGCDVYIAGKMMRALHAEEAFGYTFEKIVLFAESLGIGTTWIAGTMNRDAFERAMAVSSDEVMPCVSPLGYPSRKMSVREALMRKGVGADSRLEFGELFFDEVYGRALAKEKAGGLTDALEAVRLGPSAVNKQPWRVILSGDKVHFYEKHSKGFVSEKWDTQKIDMGIALCHFELVARESGYSVCFEVADPGLPVADDAEYIASFSLSRSE